MPSDSGSQERRAESVARIRNANKEALERLRDWGDDRQRSQTSEGLTPEEADRIADGEPYCFRCGKPASSFSEYSDSWIDSQTSFTSRADYVRQEEGTYNPETNRFACDVCYIAIGMPTGPYGWVAP